MLPAAGRHGPDGQCKHPRNKRLGNSKQDFDYTILVHLTRIMMKRTTADRSDNSGAYEASVKRARTEGTPVAEAQATASALPPSMSEKRNLLAVLGSRKEIAAGEFGGPLGEIRCHWQLPLDVTIKIASLLKLPSEWKGLTLSGRQGYLSVDAAHPGRRFPGLAVELANLCPGTHKASAHAVRQYLDKLAPDGMYSRALLTGLSFEVRLAAHLAVLCWSRKKVFQAEHSSVETLIIENLETLKKTRGTNNFEDDVHAALPLLRSGTRKKEYSAKRWIFFGVEELQLLSARKILSNSAVSLLEAHKACLRYLKLPLNEMYGDKGFFWNNALSHLNITDLATLAAIGDNQAQLLITDRLTSMPLEKRHESACEINFAVQNALAQGHLSLAAPHRTWSRINDLLWSSMHSTDEPSFDDHLMRVSVKTITSTYRYTERLWNTRPRRGTEEFCDLINRDTDLSQMIGRWITTLPHPEAKRVLEELPAALRRRHSGVMN
jgi:hypothetical protein